MEFTPFAIVATFPRTYDVEPDKTKRKRQVCYNSRMGLSKPCCAGSKCNYSVGFISTCK